MNEININEISRKSEHEGVAHGQEFSSGIGQEQVVFTESDKKQTFGGDLDKELREPGTDEKMKEEELLGVSAAENPFAKQALFEKILNEGEEPNQ
jgi:hypothetical protein